MNEVINTYGKIDFVILNAGVSQRSFIENTKFDVYRQLFEVNFPGLTRIAVTVKQVTSGDFDVHAIVDLSGDNIIVSRTDMNHADEIYSYNLKKKTFIQLTKTNNETYSKLALPKFERRYVTTTDGKKMLVWVILPPNFDKTKKYRPVYFL